VDEAGFYLLPLATATYAPRGETPVLTETVTRDHLAMISGVTSAGKLYRQIYDGTIRGAEVVAFLAHLERHIPGKLLVFWDGASIHRNRVVRQFLAAGHAARIEVVALPGYAPELNPDEGVWHSLKSKELANVACADLPELRRELRLATGRLQHRPEVIRGYFRQAGYV
jgi:transposase